MRAALEQLFASLPGFRIVAGAATEAEANLWLDEHVSAYVSPAVLRKSDTAALMAFRHAMSDQENSGP